MSRLSLDTTLGWLPRDPSISVPSLLDALQPGAASFDQHLQQAQQTVDSAAGDGPREPSTSSTQSDSRQSHAEERSPEPASHESAAHADESSRRSAPEASHEAPQSASDRPSGPAVESNRKSASG